MSKRHKEAMAHLSYGLSQGGCFIVLSGEVGTGKTTLCRNLLTELPDNVDVALILNANINEKELLQTICDELKISYKQKDSQKQLLDKINTYLLKTFSENRHTVLIIDEAQLLSRDVLEQIRLLTNLETTKSKLLQIILIGQPELNDLLSRNDLRQLAQRVTARYHLGALQRSEIEDYINYRLGVAGCKKALFSNQALTKMHALTEGIPRKINVLADHALLATYSKTDLMVDAKTVNLAAKDVFFKTETSGNELLNKLKIYKWQSILALAILLNIGLWWWFAGSNQFSKTENIVRPQVEISNNSLMEEVSEKQPDTRLGSENKPSIAISQNDDGVFVVENNLKDEPVKGVMTISEELLDDSTELTIEQQSVLSSSNNINNNEIGVKTPAVEVEISMESGISDEEQDLISITNNPVTSELGQLLDTSSDVTNRIGAYRRLAKLWQVTLNEQLIQPVCTETAQQGLLCLSFTDWTELELYNRPAIIVINHQDRLHRVIVRSIDGANSKIIVGDKVLVASENELLSRWTGSGALLWRPSEVGTKLRKLGDRDDEIVTLRGYLNRALNKARLPLLQSIEINDFDIDMSQKVFALQTRFGIAGDSRIGDQTYLLMNEIILPSKTPVLVQRSSK